MGKYVFVCWLAGTAVAAILSEVWQPGIAISILLGFAGGLIGIAVGYKLEEK